MTFPLEYHDVVNCSVTRSWQGWLPLALGMFLLPLLVSPSPAQISSTGASSSGSSHSASVAPYTGPVSPPTGGFVHNGFTPGNSGVTISTHTPHSPSHSGSNANHHPHRSVSGTAYYPYIYALPVPYAVDVSDADSSDNDDDDDAEYQGGPTIFDRRGSGPDSYIPPSSPGPAHAQLTQDASAEDAPVAESAPEPSQPPTTLVFKDGHQIEVNNYAIVSQTLYDLTPGHPRKIPVADLDLTATQKQNDDHGVVFQLPPSPQAN
jgi:hypothetical protein